LGKLNEISSFNVVFSDIRVQAFIVTVEFFTMPMDVNKFASLKQSLNLFVLQAMDRLELRITAEGAKNTEQVITNKEQGTDESRNKL
ncbi:MAG TPA: hypothetical protein VNA26_05795, partial [Chitinophagaceae bacterium]|nr:hypothetical protein [Chitinophagaceae bacterium]